MKSKFKKPIEEVPIEDVGETILESVEVEDDVVIESTPEFLEVPLSQVEGLKKEGYKCVGSYFKDGKKVYKVVK